MKRFLAVLLAGALVLAVAASPALAGKKKKKKPAPVVVEETGTIQGANPAGQVLFGVTEGEFTQVHTCAQMPASQGVDGWVIELPEAFWMKGGALELAGSSPAPYDLNVYYYDVGCTLMADVWLTGGGADEAGAVPIGAKWIVVDAIVGANNSFTLNATSNV
jgi:extracellular elastinolytic metalloproteinase